MTTRADETTAPLSLRRIALPAFGPAVLFSLGEGAVMPVLPLTARELGASTAGAAALLTIFTVGTLLSNIPASALAVRVGERRSILIASLLGIAATAAMALAPSLAVLTLALVLYGASFAMFSLARMAWLVEAVPLGKRARALSTLGGSHRIGMFAGPFIGAAVIHLAGITAAYAVAVAGLALAALIALVMPDPADAGHWRARGSVRRAAGAPRGGSAAAGRDSELGFVQVVRANARVLAIAGVTIMLCSAVRMSRQVVVPLWGDHVGLDPATTSVVYGISGLVDMLVFYPAGFVMDRFGRRWVTVPSMLLLGAGLMLLAAAHSLPALTGAAMLIGLGNGIGSGMVMTLGADLSPTVGRTQFLAAWRSFSDLGTVIGPAVIASVTASAGLGAAVVASGGFGLLAALAFGLAVPRAQPHPSR